MDSSDDEDGGDDDGGQVVQQESPQEAAAVVVEPVEPEPLEGAPTQEQGDGAGSETEDDTDDEEAQVAQLAAHVAPALAAQPANGDDQHEGAMPQPEDLQLHATQPPDDAPELAGVPHGTAGSETEDDHDEEEAAETAEDSAAAAATAISASVHKAVAEVDGDDYMRQAREKAESEGGAFDDELGAPSDELEVEEEDDEEDAEGEGEAGAPTATDLEESGLMELFTLALAVCYEEYYELMASWRPEGGDWLLTDCRRVYRLRRQAAGRGAGCSGDEPNELPPLPCAALQELQSAPFEDGGFVSQHLQTEPENGLFVLAVLFGWKVSDDALEVYVDAAAREEARNRSRGGRSGRRGGRAGRHGRMVSSRGGGSSGGGGSSSSRGGSSRGGGSSSSGGGRASGHGSTKRPHAEQDQAAESDSSEGQSVD